MSELELLQQKADALRQRLDQIHADYRTGLPSDSEERAQRLENAEVLNEIERVTSEELEQVLIEMAEFEKT